MYIYNARIHTLNDRTPVVSALAIHRDRILALGDDQVMHSEFEGRLPGIDLEGRLVIPGLTDAHIHLEEFALGLQKVDCETSTRGECLARVAERARLAAPETWILGHGWNQNDWEEGFGTAADLDALVPNHPVYLTSKSLHTAWVNTAALRLANISAATPDTRESRLGRYDNGEPDGILFEGATKLVEDAIPKPTTEQVAQAIQTAQGKLWCMGLTGVHDFDQRTCFLALQSLRQCGALRLRVLKSIPLEDMPHAVALGLRSGFGDDWLRVGGVKIFADGALSSHTAALFQPFHGLSGNRGMLFKDAEELFEHGRLAVENGLSLAVHAIGDRANHEVLKAFANLRNQGKWGISQKPLPPGMDLRHRIEHVQLVHPDDAALLAELGLVASMQPIHATSDMETADRYWGPRTAFSYAFQTQLSHGAILAFGSDAPVESPNPFWGLHAAVTRRRSDGSPGPQGWHPEQRLSVAQALRAYTLGAAYAAGWEQRLGKLAPGYLADLLVLEDDPFNCQPECLREIRPLATMVGGEWVFVETARAPDGLIPVTR